MTEIAHKGRSIAGADERRSVPTVIVRLATPSGSMTPVTSEACGNASWRETATAAASAARPVAVSIPLRFIIVYRVNRSCKS